MGRGISALQRVILAHLIENNFLTFQDLLCLVWGWEPADWGSKKATIGEGQYNAAYASMSRTLDRLWRRGLVTIWKSITCPGTGVSLTAQGQALTRSILGEAENASLRLSKRLTQN